MPVVNIEHHPNGSTVVIWEIIETEAAFLQHVSGPDNVLEELVLINNPQRRLERLAVRALLDKLPDRKVCLRYHDNGRPFLANNSGYISICHTKRFAAVTYNEKYPVGCDMECRSRNFSAVEKKALSEKERRYLNDKEHNFQLCLLWCAKEAVYKCVGEDGIDFARQIFIEEFSPGEKGTLKAIYTGHNGLETAFELCYKTFENHAVVWTMNNEQ
jgi:phosphopantetheinyl transferase